MASQVESSKKHVKAQSKRQSRPSSKRLSALEPVLEHYELACCSASNNCSAQQLSKPKSCILTKIRDVYVKLMNDMAGTDLSFSGATGGPAGRILHGRPNY
jgi:hypothetical protein